MGPPGSFPVISFRDALAAARGKRPSQIELSGVIVLIGATAQGQQNVHATPCATKSGTSSVGGRMTGTEIHAHVIATLQDQAYIVPQPGLSSLPLLVLFGAGLGWIFNSVSLGKSLFVAVGHHFAWKGLALAAFCYGRGYPGEPVYHDLPDRAPQALRYLPEVESPAALSTSPGNFLIDITHTPLWCYVNCHLLLGLGHHKADALTFASPVWSS